MTDWYEPISIQTVAPTGEAVTLAEIKAQCQLPASFTGDDTLLTRLMDTAIEALEKELESAILTQTRRVKIDCFPSWAIVLDYPPLQSVSSIAYIDVNGDSQTLDAANYTVVTDSKPGYVVPAYGLVWPNARGHVDDVTITYVAGYGATTATVPEPIRHALLLMITDAYRNRMPCCSCSDTVYALTDKYNFRDFTFTV